MGEHVNTTAATRTRFLAVADEPVQNHSKTGPLLDVDVEQVAGSLTLLKLNGRMGLKVLRPNNTKMEEPSGLARERSSQ